MGIHQQSTIDFGNSKMASITKITNRLHFAKRMFSTSTARMSHASPAEVSLWKKLFFFGAVPVIAFGHYMTFRPYFAPYPGEDPHARPDFVPYEYLRIRSKKFPWAMETNRLSATHMQTPYPTGMKRVTI